MGWSRYSSWQADKKGTVKSSSKLDTGQQVFFDSLCFLALHYIL